MTQCAVSFAATNIDDIFMLALFFGRLGRGLKTRHVVIGQYLGFAALVVISLAGYFARLLVTQEWIGLLGLLPIAIGVHHFLKREPEDEKQRAGRAEGVFSVAAVTFGAPPKAHRTRRVQYAYIEKPKIDQRSLRQPKSRVA